MRIDRTHPLSREIEVYLDGEQQHFCLMADDREGIALLNRLDDQGQPLWNADQNEPQTELRRGTVRFEARPGYEERLTWFRIGWIHGFEEALAGRTREAANPIAEPGAAARPGSKAKEA